MRPKKQQFSDIGVSGVGEFGLIEQLSRGLQHSPSVIRGIGDDAAVLNINARQRLLLTTDMLVEDVHFTRKMSAKDVGYKSMACNISDIAAMGGLPKFAVISIGLPPKLPVKWVKDFYAGLEDCARKFGVAIVGGDTVKSDKIVINVALTGEADFKKIVLRSGARPGDIIFVTGRLGNSFKSGRHLKPHPRVQEAQDLVNHFKVHAMIDVSDGLAADLGHILGQSGVGAILDAAAIPLHKDATLDQALYDGEDYELVLTVGATPRGRPDEGRHGGLPLQNKFYPIGRIVKDPKTFELHFSDGNIKKIKSQGYRHF